MQTNDETQGETMLRPPEPIKAPDAVKTVDPQKVGNVIPLTNQDKTKIEDKVKSEVDSLLSLEVHGDEFRQRVENLANIAQDEIRNSAAASNRLLDKPVRSLQSGGISQGSKVGTDLLTLRREMEKLDPSKIGLGGGAKKLFGLIPMGIGNKITDYVHSYASAKDQIDAIVESLYRGKDELLRDNASLEEEKASIWNQMISLQKYSYFTEKIDDELSARIAALKNTDPDRARIIETEVLFRLRQRRQDIMTQAAVNTQGYMSMDLVKRNNTELAMAVERTTTTTISALRTAVLTAQALSAQKDVLQQVQGVNATTNSLILGTSEMLKQNAEGIAQISSDPTVSVKTLQQSFDNVFAAMDTADNYRVKALDSMKQTIDGLQTVVEKSKNYLDKERQEKISGAVSQPALAAIKLD